MPDRRRAGRERSDMDDFRQFDDPRELIERKNLSDEDKIKVLQDWQSDLIQLQKAVEENMPSISCEPGETAVKLTQVTAAIAKLNERREKD
jgi:hypothetical protein